MSKVGARRDKKGSWLPALTPDQLREDVETNLRELGTERLAAVNLRLQEHPVPGQAPYEDLLAAMVRMREDGLIAGVGISTATLAQVEQAIAQAGVVTVQNAYSLLAREDEAVLRLCSDHGISYVPYFPLGSAFPGMPKVVDDPVVQAVAQQTDATPAQVGLAWLLAHDDSTLLIPGTSSVAHLEQNMAVAAVQLTDSQLAQLDAVAPPT